MRIHEKEPRVDYDSGRFFRRIRLEDPKRRSPLADRALANLFDANRPGPRILAAAPGLWGADLAERLYDLASDWHDNVGIFAPTGGPAPLAGVAGDEKA